MVADCKVEDEVPRADDTITRRDAHRTLPCLHLVDDEISGAGNFVVAQVLGDDVVVFIFVRHRTNEDTLLTSDREQWKASGVALVPWPDECAKIPHLPVQWHSRQPR